MKLLGVAGWSGAGKTTLIEALLPHLISAGLRVSTIKHTHHGFDLDQPGKDSYRHRVAGAHEVLLVGDRRLALLQEFQAQPPGLPALLARLEPVDLVLIEGFRDHPVSKLEVHRPALGREALWPMHPEIIAVASDAPLEDCPRRVLDLNAPWQIAAWITSSGEVTEIS